MESNTKDKENTPPPPPPRDVTKERNDFYADPVGALERQLSVREEKLLKQMEKMISPLKDVASSFRATSEYDRLKAAVKLDPVFGKGLRDPDVEAAVDSIAKQGGFEMTEDNVRSLVAQTMGIKAMGGLRSSNGRSTAPTPTNDDRERIDPPQIPTTRTRSQLPEQTKELTEDDRLAMRFAKLNPNNPEHVKEYWALMDDEAMTLSVHKAKENK